MAQADVLPSTDGGQAESALGPLPWLDDQADPLDTPPPAAATPLWAAGPDLPTLWAWQTADGLHMQLRVPDAHHHPASGAVAASLPQGDSIEVSLHVLKQHAAAYARRSEIMYPGDLFVAFALGEAHATGVIGARGAPEGGGPWRDPLRIYRTEDGQATVYRWLTPWTLLKTEPGSTQMLGLGIKVNRYDGSGLPQPGWRWGIDAAGGFRPDTLVPVMLAQAPTASAAQKLAAATMPSPLHMAPPRRALLPQLHAADQCLASLRRRTQSPHVLAHLVGLRALLGLAGAQAMAEAQSPATAAHWAAWDLAAEILAQGRNFSAWQEDLLRGERPLILALRAAGDGALQPYLLYLPQQEHAVAPDSGWPLVTYLHGKGDPSLVHFVADACAHGGMGDPNALVVMPWARGNLGQVGLAETDVLEAVAAAAQLTPVDAERIVLAGFSMGATLAWSVALHYPEPWAAVGLASGGTWLTPLGHGLGQNVAHLPFYIWHGMADGTVPVAESHRMVDELRASGADFEAHFAVGQGHKFLRSERQRMTRSLMGHRRQHPSCRTYVSDGPLHRGLPGILLRYDASLNAFPSYTLERTGTGLNIRSRGTAGLDVDLAILTGGAQGEVQVHHQGRPVYRGSKMMLELGLGAPRP